MGFFEGFGVTNALDFATGIGNSLMSRNAQKKSDERNFRYQQEMAKFQNQKNVEMWNMQNAYNSPAQQMARLDQAGLNPNLVYGSGTVAGNSAHDIPSYQAPSPDFHAAPIKIPAVLSILSQFQDLNIKTTQAKSIEADVTKKRIENSFLYQVIQKSLDSKDLGNRRLGLELGALMNSGGIERNESGHIQYDQNISPYMRSYDASVNERNQNTLMKSLQSKLLQKDLDLYDLLGTGGKGTDFIGRLLLQLVGSRKSW